MMTDTAVPQQHHPGFSGKEKEREREVMSIIEVEIHLHGYLQILLT